LLVLSQLNSCFFNYNTFFRIHDLLVALVFDIDPKSFELIDEPLYFGLVIERSLVSNLAIC
jgi:hypothetical protein